MEVVLVLAWPERLKRLVLEARLRSAHMDAPKPKLMAHVTEYRSLIYRRTYKEIRALIRGRSPTCGRKLSSATFLPALKRALRTGGLISVVD